jgi:cellulose synthase/poly-beta-1,6-N-acetylglucosamine synthase-like glycosyltransferase
MEKIFSIMAVLSGLLCLTVTIWGGYYFFTGLMSWRKPLDYGWHPTRTRFAVLIAARNEELVIGPLINSLLTQNYPAELYDIWVLPNNCTDHTARAAKSFGAKVLECTVPVKNKGDVLRFAYQNLRGGKYDAYCVFDADNLVDQNFLLEMNHAYMAGARVAQGYRDSKNPYDSIVAGCYSIYYWMMDRFHNGGKVGIGLSAMVNGTGFMISAQTLEKLGGWHTQTISEDLELTAQCILNGEKVAWVPKAITYDEQPVTYALSVKQRRRWSSGTLQVAECYLAKSGQELASGKHPLAHFDLIATLLVPAYQIVALLGLVVSSLSACGTCHKLAQVPGAFLGAVALNLAGTIIVTTLAAVLVITVEGKWDRRLVKSVCFYWLFLLSWIPITVGSFVRKTTVWEEIRHTRNITPEAMAKGRILIP